MCLWRREEAEAQQCSTGQGTSQPRAGRLCLAMIQPGKPWCNWLFNHCSYNIFESDDSCPIHTFHRRFSEVCRDKAKGSEHRLPCISIALAEDDQPVCCKAARHTACSAQRLLRY